MKNRGFWRYEMEREGAMKVRRPRRRAANTGSPGAVHGDAHQRRGRTRPYLVVKDRHPSERRQTAIEDRTIRVVPDQLDVRDPPRGSHEIKRAFPEHLVRHVHIAAFRVSRLWNIHAPSLSRQEPRVSLPGATCIRSESRNPLFPHKSLLLDA